MSGIIYIGNTNVIELRGLTNSVTGVLDTGASVTVTLVDLLGANVAGETWPVTATGGAGGVYTATLSEGIEVLSGRKYTAQVTAVGSGGSTGLWNCEVRARVRECE